LLGQCGIEGAQFGELVEHVLAVGAAVAGEVAADDQAGAAVPVRAVDQGRTVAAVDLGIDGVEDQFEFLSERGSRRVDGVVLDLDQGLALLREGLHPVLVVGVQLALFVIVDLFLRHQIDDRADTGIEQGVEHRVALLG